MMQNLLISLISIGSSTVISIISLYILWKEKKHNLYYVERNNEKREVVDLLSEYLKYVSVYKMETMIKRAQIINNGETTNEFCDFGNNYIEQIQVNALRLSAIPEVGNKMIFDFVIQMKDSCCKCLLEIVDLKAACSKRELSLANKEYISRLINSIEKTYIPEISELEQFLLEYMSVTVESYSKRIKQT